MGLQVVCPLCGLSRPPDRFGAHDLAAKEVKSLGGNRGFEHEPVELPDHLEREIQQYLAELYHDYVEFDPLLGVTSSVVMDTTGIVRNPTETTYTTEVDTNVTSRPD